MKKVLAVNICVLMIMFLTAGMLSRPETDTGSAQSLISQRISLLNQYYSGKKTQEQTTNALEKIETGKLLREDAALMKAFANTDIERIPSHKVKIKKSRTMRYGIIKGTAEVTYIMEGNQGKYKQSAQYYFTGEKEDDGIKLTQFEKI